MEDKCVRFFCENVKPSFFSLKHNPPSLFLIDVYYFATKCNFLLVLVAQWTAHQTSNLGVAGSNPVGSAGGRKLLLLLNPPVGLLWCDCAETAARSPL